MTAFESVMTRRGQVTIPVAMRERLRLQPGDRVRFVIVDGEVVIEPATSRLLAGFGAVAPLNRPEDWRAIREEFERLVAEDAAADG